MSFDIHLVADNKVFRQRRKYWCNNYCQLFVGIVWVRCNNWMAAMIKRSLFNSRNQPWWCLNLWHMLVISTRAIDHEKHSRRYFFQISHCSFGANKKHALLPDGLRCISILDDTNYTRCGVKSAKFHLTSKFLNLWMQLYLLLFTHLR